MSSVDCVVVMGADAVAWLAAISLHRAFRHRQLDVVVVDSIAGRQTPGVRWTLPSQRGMHALIGVQEPDFLRRTGATYKLASEHLGWQGEGSRFLHAHGDIGTAIGAAPFYKFLLREAIAGRPGSAEDYSLAAVAARQGRFARPMGDAAELTSSFTYGFHVDEAAYVAYLREHATRAGVRRVEGAIAGMDVAEDGHIRVLRLEGGETVAGDLFIDCAAATADADRIDWSEWLPCDRVIYATAPAIANPPPVTQTTAAAAGWTWRLPLADAAAVGYVYASAFIDDAAALAHLQTVAPGARAAKFRSGRRRKFWKHNCVALGAAAVELEPLAGADLHLAQTGIATLIELFPLDARSTVESVDYNRVMSEHADALRDFTIAHYRAGHARPGEFWNATRAAPLPDTLAYKLDLFGANGRIDIRDHESFEEVDWAWLLIGTACVPRALEMQMTALLQAVTVEQMLPLRTHIERLAASMPRHIEYVRHQASAPPRGNA
ncbi:MAG TPA: tryptophan halogenase family protein [Steroidobacteraceae bacterium]|nr:tryptophan halogenase family protein [Steroidobacteraceae bacterium]